MKTKRTIQQMMLTAGLLLSLSACKKNPAGDPPVIPPAEVKMMSFTDLKVLSTADEVKVPDAKKIKGVVISDLSGKNLDNKTIVLQEADNQPGIVIGFDAAQTFAVGDQLEVNISGQKLQKQNGEIVLSQVPAANAKKTGTGAIAGRTTTVAEAIKNAALWNGTLVSLGEGALSGGNGKYSGVLNFDDKSAGLKSMVLAGAAFENTAYPASVESIKGILRTRGKDVFLDIRTAKDVATGSISRLLSDEMYVTSKVDKDMTFGYGDFETRTMNYSQGGSMVYIPGDKFDGDMLTKDRAYVYLMSGAGDASSAYFNAGPSVDLKGIKEITVTFAGSKMTGDAIIADYYSVPPFDPSKDVFKISIGILSYASFPVATEFKEAGKFYTVKFKIPSREELIKGEAGSVQVIDNWLAAPIIMIRNESTRAASSQGNAPIVIKQIVYGF
eukprot:gene19279-22936_t